MKVLFLFFNGFLFHNLAPSNFLFLFCFTEMNTRTFKKVLVSLQRISQLISDAKALAEKEHLDISEEQAEKYKMKTLWKSKRPLYKWYSYKS